MQRIIPSTLGDLRSSTGVSAAFDFDSLSTYINRDSRYGRFGSNPPRRFDDWEAGRPFDPAKHSQSLTQRVKNRPRPSIYSLFPSLRRHLSRSHKTPSTHTVRSVTSQPSIYTANSLEEYENEGSLDDVVSESPSMQSTVASRLPNTQRASSPNQELERMSQVANEWLNALHPVKKRRSETRSSVYSTPPRPCLRAISGNTLPIPSLSLPGFEPTSSATQNLDAPYILRAHQQGLASRLNWLSVDDARLSPPAHKLGPVRLQHSLDESVFRHRDTTPGLRAISGNTLPIPSSSFPGSEPTSSAIQSPGASCVLEADQQDLTSRLDWLNVNDGRLSLPAHKLGPVRLQRSLDESVFRHKDTSEPLRIIRRVGNLHSRSLGCVSTVAVKKPSRSSSTEISPADKENTQVRASSTRWEVKGLDNTLMKPASGGGRQSVCLETTAGIRFRSVCGRGLYGGRGKE